MEEQPTQKPTNDPIDTSWLISLIGDALKEAKIVAEKIARGTGGREIALAITKLEEARHRAVDAMMLLENTNHEAKSDEQS